MTNDDRLGKGGAEVVRQVGWCRCRGRSGGGRSRGLHGCPSGEQEEPILCQVDREHLEQGKKNVSLFSCLRFSEPQVRAHLKVGLLIIII